MTKHVNDFTSDSGVCFGVVSMDQLKLELVFHILIIALCPFTVHLLCSHLPLPSSLAFVSSFRFSVV